VTGPALVVETVRAFKLRTSRHSFRLRPAAHFLHVPPVAFGLVKCVQGAVHFVMVCSAVSFQTSDLGFAFCWNW
jgi:hypothetical protein